MYKKILILAITVIAFTSVANANYVSGQNTFGIGIYSTFHDNVSSGIVGNGGLTLSILDLRLGGNFHLTDEVDSFNISADYILLNLAAVNFFSLYSGLGLNFHTEIYDKASDNYTLDFRLLLGYGIYPFPQPIEIFMEFFPKISTRVVENGSGIDFDFDFNAQAGFRVYLF